MLTRFSEFVRSLIGINALSMRLSSSSERKAKRFVVFFSVCFPALPVLDVCLLDMSSKELTRYFWENTSMVPVRFEGEVVYIEFWSLTKILGGSNCCNCCCILQLLLDANEELLEFVVAVTRIFGESETGNCCGRMFPVDPEELEPAEYEPAEVASSIVRKLLGDNSRHGDDMAESCDTILVGIVASSRHVSLPAVVVAIIMSSTPSSIGDDIDWKLLNRKLDEPVERSPSVNEPKAESCDGLLRPYFKHFSEYSKRRLFEFL